LNIKIFFTRNHLFITKIGKDRTGLIAMLTLHIVGASDDEIIADYVLSDSAYKDIKDSKAMVVAMKQVS
jgi:protein tyrosine/serine phosphatase